MKYGKKLIFNYYIDSGSSWSDTMRSMANALKDFTQNTGLAPSYIALGKGMFDFCTNGWKTGLICKGINRVNFVQRILRPEYYETDDCYTVVYDPQYISPDDTQVWVEGEPIQ